jgi:hypothetical protein
MNFNTPFFSILLQLGLATLGLAAPVSTKSLDNSWQYGTGGGLLGLVILVLDIIVFGMSSSIAHVTLHVSRNALLASTRDTDWEQSRF